MENYGNFSMMKREALDALLSLKEKVRYLPGLRTYIGFRQGSVEFVRDDRLSGEPKMTIRKLILLAIRCHIFIFTLPYTFLSYYRYHRSPVFLLQEYMFLFPNLPAWPVPGWSSVSSASISLDALSLSSWGFWVNIYTGVTRSPEQTGLFCKK
jgi:dolichol-phosphate mannosyltransferase